MGKKRVEWQVSLYPCNVGKHKGKSYPRVKVKRTISLDGLIDAVMRDRSELRRETLKSVASQLLAKAEELLIEGHSLSTPLGILTPSVTGLWNSNRFSPEARNENKAIVNYTMSKELKEAFLNPYFKNEVRRPSVPHIYKVRNLADGNTEGIVAPGAPILIEGKLLLMSGELPQRGLYLIRVADGEEAAFIPADKMLTNSRSHIFTYLPDDLPAGSYRLKVVSQCTTNPRPMKTAASGMWDRYLEVGERI